MPVSAQQLTTPTLDVTVTNNIVPTFAAIPAICSGAAAPTLPATSTNGITGTWSPATVSNTASGTYTFTPSAGQCATTATLDVTVTNNTVPTFAAIPAICSGTAAPALPATSTNGITGTWSPATISNTASGTYTFTPSAGQCATATTLDVTVTDNTFRPSLRFLRFAPAQLLRRFLRHRRTASRALGHQLLSAIPRVAPIPSRQVPVSVQQLRPWT
jgi:large repetitive protein